MEGAGQKADLREVLEPCQYKVPLPEDDRSGQLGSDFLPGQQICRLGMNSARKICDTENDSLIPNLA